MLFKKGTGKETPNIFPSNNISKLEEDCSSHNNKHTLPTELTKVPLHDLSHARYF